MIDELMNRAHDRRVAMQEAFASKGSVAQGLQSAPSAGYGWGAPQTALAREELRHFTGWVHAAVRVVAQRIAGQPICIGKKSAAGAKPQRSVKKGHAPAVVKQAPGDIEPVEDHWLLRTLQRPNPYTVGWSLLYVTVVSLELVGETFWWLCPNEDGEMQIWYLPRSWVTPQDSEDGLFTSYIVRPLNTGEQIELPPEQIVRFHLPDPANPIKGAASPLMSQVRAVLADEQLQVSQHKAFENGVNPGMAVVIGRHPDVAGVPGQRPILSKEQRASLTAALKQAYRGALNAGEPVVLDGLIEDMRKITNTPQEMDFLQSGEATKARIYQGFGVNPISAGQVEGANRASATIADEHLCANTLNPLIELISASLTFDLAVKAGEPDLLIWVEPARTRDPDQQRSDLDQLAKYGALKVNELRAAYDLPPLDGPEGDELISQAGPTLNFGDGGDGQRAGSFRW